MRYTFVKSLSRHRCPAQWPKMLGAAAVGGAVTLFLGRNFFPSEKKIHHEIFADYAVGDDVFIRMMGNMLGPPLLKGNKVTVFENGDQIFPALLEAIRSAERTITFENFLFREGEVADAFAEALAERAGAGVKVHFLQDALGCNCLHGRAMDLVRKSGVQLEIFRFLNVQINFRTHRKLLVIDGKTGYLGGTGISDEWKGNGRTHGYWRDSHYCLEGPAVAQMQEAFMDNWLQTRAELLHGDDYFPELRPAGDDMCQVFKSSAGEGSDSARLMLLVSIAAARRHIRIANAYFIPDKLCIQTLVDALQRGVKVEIVTPGPDIDAQWVRAVGITRWRRLLEAGARFYEYQPARFHCKYLLVDDCWASVGSANLDNRSLSLNEEANLNVLDKKFVTAHTRVFEEDKSHSREITLADWRRRPWGEKIKGRIGSLLASQM
ncbi:MAG TPA: phospholipase D-like domain-containing protein [Candidatus Udaeobacter sp.]|nr:phospholipase D-like domain-containing protein [Candidatus Udaeobacter sp.]